MEESREIIEKEIDAADPVDIIHIYYQKLATLGMTVSCECVVDKTSA